MMVQLTCAMVLLSGEADFVKESEDAIIRRMERDWIWSDPKEADRLLGDLARAQKLKLEGAVPILLDHIDFAPHSENSLPVQTIQMKYPVLSVLAAIGPVAVPQLLDRLGTLEVPPNQINVRDPRKAPKIKFDPDHTSLKRSLLACSLVPIYEKGGFGKALAKERIAFEVKKNGRKKNNDPQAG